MTGDPMDLNEPAILPTDFDVDYADLGKLNGEQAEARPPEYSDESLALEFARRHADRLRYVAPWSHWLFWNGTCWRRDESLLAFDLSRAVCRDAAAKCNRNNRGQIASAKTVAAIERLAKADRRHAASVDQWDADPDIINTMTGAEE